VHRYEGLVDGDDLAAAHEAYRLRRSAAIVRHDLVAPVGEWPEPAKG
jgi:hypothetical protein